MINDDVYRVAIIVTPFLILIWQTLLQWQIMKMRKKDTDQQAQKDKVDRLVSSSKRIHDRVSDLDETVKAMPGLEAIEALKGDLKSVVTNMTSLGKSLENQSKLLAGLAEQRERLVRLESHVDHFPEHIASQGDVQQVHDRVSGLRTVVDGVAKDVGGIGREVASTAATMRSINGNLDILNKSELLKQGRKDD